MPERIHAGPALVVLGAAALFASLFLDWFQPGHSAWTVFEVLDLVMAAIAVASVAAVIPPRLLGAAARPLVPQRWLPALGAVALLIVAEALVNHPPAAAGRSPEVGAWIGLAAAIVLTAGGVLTTARISLVITFRSTERRRDAVAPEPPIDPDTETRPLSEPRG